MSKENHYLQILERFKGKKILIIGDVMIDSYVYGKVERISPEAPVPVVHVTKRENRLGGAANVAINIKMLGAIPLLFTVTGDDEKGNTFKHLLEEHHISTSGILTSKERITTTKFRVIGNNSHLLRVDEEINTTIEPEITAKLIELIVNVLHQNDVGCIVFQDYDKGVISPMLIDEITKIARSSSIPVAVDPKKKNFFNYHYANLFKPNLKELTEGMKLNIIPEQLEKLSQITLEFQKSMNIEKCMVTLSEKGIFMSAIQAQQSVTYHEAAQLRNIADVSGAGDTVISVAALCLACKTQDEDLIKLSNLAGGIVCQFVGVHPVTMEMLVEETSKLC